MSLDIRLSSPSEPPLTDDERQHLLALLDRYGVRPLRDANWLSASFGDCGVVLRLGENAARFSAFVEPVGRVNLKLCEFLYELAAITRSSIRVDAVPPLTLLVYPAIDPDAPASAVRVSSAHAIRAALTGGRSRSGA
jgi:hypothetical protein